ncbi:DUF7507 domain-containing protein [Leucobacter sp.]
MFASVLGDRALRVLALLLAVAVALGGSIVFAAPALAAGSTDLELSQSASPTPAVTGSELTWTIRVANLGPDTGTSVAVNGNFNEFGDASEFVSLSTTRGSCTHDERTYYCTIGDVPSGSTVTLTLVVTVLSASSVASVADLQAANDSSYDNNHVVDTVPAGVAADVGVTKTAEPSSAAPGDTVAFTLTAHNDGPSSAAGVQLVDPLPSGLEDVSVSPADDCTVTGGEVSCAVGTLAAGASFTRVVTARIDSAFAGSRIENTAAVTTTTTDSDPSNDSATAAVEVLAPAADLAVTKTLGTDPVVAGQPVEYTIAVENRGPAEAVAAALADELPPALSEVSASTDLGECAETGGTVSCDFGTLTASGTATVRVSGLLAASATGELSNTAEVLSGTADPDTANNTSTATAEILAVSDLSIAKTGSPATASNGDTVEYTVLVRNTGPSDAAGVVVTDPIPGDLQYVAGSCATPAGTCRFADGTLVFSLGALGAGRTAELAYSATVDAAAPDERIVNTATVSHDGTDPEPSNDEASYTLNVDAAADVSLTKTADPATAAAGGTVTFEIVARNAGPGASRNLELSDAVPASVQVSAVTPSAGSCDSGTSNEVHCTLDELASGEAWTILVVGILDPSAPAGLLVNTARIVADDDPTASNNAATAVVRTVARADLSPIKSAPAVVTAGNELTYSLEAANAGPSTARSAVVVDALPRGTRFLSAADATCVATGAGPQLVRCALGDLAPEEARAFTITVQVDPRTPDGAVLVNRAQISSATPGASDELVATASTTVSASADLMTMKAVSPDALIAGAPAAYLIRVTNHGPSSASAVTVEDVVPGGLQIESVGPAAGVCAVTGQEIVCERDALAPQATWSIVVRVRVADDAAGTILNSATATSETDDPNPADNTGTATSDVATAADLRMIKTALTPAPAAGGTAVFVLAVLNNGPSAAADAVVDDVLPDGLTPVSATGACAIEGRRISCAYDAIPSGGVRSSLVLASVVADAEGVLRNTATVTAATADPEPRNDTATATVDVAAGSAPEPPGPTEPPDPPTGTPDPGPAGPQAALSGAGAGSPATALAAGLIALLAGVLLLGRGGRRSAPPS